MLSDQQVRFFRALGYLKAPLAIPDGLLSRLRERASQDISTQAGPLTQDPQGRVLKLSGLFQRGGVFAELIASEVIVSPLTKLLGPNIVFTLNRHNHLTVNLKGSQVVRLHRDILQWSRSLVTAIVYLEESTIDNGCTYLIPGSHYFPFVGTPNNGGTWMDEHSVYADLIDQAIPVPMKKGEILFFDSLVFHTVGPNTTEFSRMSIALGYHSVDELSNVADAHKIIVAGEALYRGNELILA